MMKKKTKLILSFLIIAVMIPIFIVAYLLSPWILMSGYTAVYSFFTPNPPKPQITYAEFPFELVYEIDGESFVVNDIYVCEFDGFEFNGGTMNKSRSWKGYVKGSGEEVITLIQDDNLQLVCSVGYPEYYMADPDSDIIPETSLTPSVSRVITHDNGTISFGGFTDEIEELMDKYRVRIISWQFSNPIDNSFT